MPGGGSSAGSPSGAPAAIHSSTVARSSGASERSCLYVLHAALGDHGGIVPSSIDAAITGAIVCASS